jgi:hypothetical protein
MSSLVAIFIYMYICLWFESNLVLCDPILAVSYFPSPIMTSVYLYNPSLFVEIYDHIMVLIAPKYFYMICPSYFLTLSVPDDGYFSNIYVFISIIVYVMSRTSDYIVILYKITFFI